MEKLVVIQFFSYSIQIILESSRFLNYYFFLGKVHISPSNYHLIVNVPPKLPIVSIAPLKLPKNVNVSPNTNKKTKITLNIFE
jgi:hypothetical protein